MAQATGCPVAVTLPATDTKRHAALADLQDLTILPIDDPTQGMSASIRAGALLAISRPEITALMILPADMPGLETPDLARLIAAATPDRPTRASGADGTPGHPVIFPRRHFAALAALTGDSGARELLKAAPPDLVPLPGYRATLDLDTPEDWARWRDNTG